MSTSISHKLLHITSRDLIPEKSKSTSDFVVMLNNTQGIQSVKSVVIKQATIPNTVYNISSVANTFTYAISGVKNNITVPEGQYNINDLITALQTAGAGIGLSIVVDPLTAKLTFNTTTSIEYLTFNEGNVMGDILGISEGSVGDVSSHIGAGSISLEGLQNVFIYSDKLGENNLINSDGRNYSFLGIIPIDVPYGRIQHYLSPHSEIDDSDSSDIRGGKNIQTIDIKLSDAFGNIIDLNGHHVELILKIYY